MDSYSIAKAEADPEFEGSIWQQLGYTDRICTNCAAHLWRDDFGNLICLNTCHLSPESRERFQRAMSLIVKEREERGGGEG